MEMDGTGCKEEFKQQLRLQGLKLTTVSWEASSLRNLQKA
jgi:hypothetical protein